MDEEMEEGSVEVFEVVEIDLDYEYDAARYFDFTRPETDFGALQSESWFELAPSYPPSPFVAKLFPTEDLYSEIVDYSFKSNYYYDGVQLADGSTNNAQEKEYPEHDTVYQGAEEKGMTSNQNLAGSSGSLLFYHHMADDMKKPRSKSSVKPSFPRSSTLMKPTASQLAKQTQRCPISGYRFQKNNSNSNAPVGIESQASKRQKLDGGLLRKIVDMKQPINLMRKVPSKNCAVPKMNSQSKPKITIPREPEFETAHRAERIRSTTIKRSENPTVTTSRFRARPLNKKIFDAPVLPTPKKNTQNMPEFQAFHLKTAERAKHLASVASTSIHHSNKVLDKTCHNRVVETGNKDDKRYEAADAPKKAACQLVHNFKARPLDRKILTSRGDLGISRNNKRDVTVPMEFQFQTSKRNQQDPPVELFNKLSLANEPQPKSFPQLELQRKPIFSKPSKENKWEEPDRQNQHVNHPTKEKVVTCGKQSQNGTNGFRISLRPFMIGRQQ